MPFIAVDPATGREVRRFEAHSRDDARAAADAGKRAQVAWAETPFDERGEVLRAAAVILEGEADRWGRLMAEEMGKPLAEGRSEAGKCAWAMRYYADHGADFLADRTVRVEGARAGWVHRPLGLVLAVMPWNFPFWQVFRAAAPTLMAGNGILLKHASNVPGCARAAEEILLRAGLPGGLFQNLFLEHDDLEVLLDHDAVQAVTLTGSVRAGKAIAAQAGARLKKCVLELGGSDPYVVLADADIDAAVETCVTSRLINTGQSCIAAKRFIVVDALHDAFRERLLHRFDAVRQGPPLDDGVDVGPMAREDLRDDLHDQVVRSVAAGATLERGGHVPDRPGAWYPPTVLTGVTREMPAFREELFGPVAVLIRAADDGEALELANDTVFGLGAAVFTRDADRGERIARDVLQAGACFVNDFVRSDPRLPFGGIKESGYGRELSPLGIREFVNAKTVWVAE
ncbi:MAG TPA: NAD-dependent succinate-semialdehyde dehydrogenase [Longimicrobiales bacterium]|nr:NAD-dependent succinate-semialdehyde dehydrogenase [Longimicrobiales bacterium]